MPFCEPQTSELALCPQPRAGIVKLATYLRRKCDLNVAFLNLRQICGGGCKDCQRCQVPVLHHLIHVAESRWAMIFDVLLLGLAWFNEPLQIEKVAGTKSGWHVSARLRPVSCLLKGDRGDRYWMVLIILSIWCLQGFCTNDNPVWLQICTPRASKTKPGKP